MVKLSELNNQRGILTKELSRLDKYISGMYHDLEGIDPSEEYALSYVTQSQLQDFLNTCEEFEETRPTPLLLKYETGGFNCLHQEL